ncbi:MAG: hypothetical protein IJM30_02790 [Thermoguttaceae bacterium]|nr:hypothetical protein [Thermoguttaceae bacterium]
MSFVLRAALWGNPVYTPTDPNRPILYLSGLALCFGAILFAAAFLGLILVALGKSNREKGELEDSVWEKAIVKDYRARRKIVWGLVFLAGALVFCSPFLLGFLPRAWRGVFLERLFQAFLYPAVFGGLIVMGVATIGTICALFAKPNPEKREELEFKRGNSENEDLTSRRASLRILSGAVFSTGVLAFFGAFLLAILSLVFGTSWDEVRKRRNEALGKEAPEREE